MDHFIKKIEYHWRRLIVYPVLRLIIRNTKIEKPISLSSINKLLIIRNDRIGDMIVTTPILRSLKNAKPELFIGIIANSNNAEIIRNNPFVDKIYTYPVKIWRLWNFIRYVRKERYDVILNFVFIKMTLGGILVNLIGPKGIKIGHGVNKYEFYYNRLLAIERHCKPMVDVLTDYIRKAIDIDEIHLTSKYEIFVDSNSKENVDMFLRQNHLKRCELQNNNGKPYIIFNLSVQDHERQLSHEQSMAIGEYLCTKDSFKTVLLISPEDRYMYNIKELLIRKKSCISFEAGTVSPLLNIAYLIEGAIGVITPDTSTVHFASTSKTPLLVFYSNLLHEWLPYRVKNKIILAGEDRFVSKIPVNEMIDLTSNFLKSITV